ncbi:MAG: L,D-transpeptidase [Myxococcales bacterium]|nr:L,D-transpeptidase [Myxococcales bacterium]
MRQTLAKFLGFGLVLAVFGCQVEDEPAVEDGYNDPEPEGEGVAFDEENPGADLGMGKADLPLTYEVPQDLPELSRPEIVVSLEGLTVHLFDRETGFSEVYPTGVGKRGSSGKSYTPTGFYKTHGDTDSTWYFIPRRYSPSYFGGFPFLRLNIENSQGHNTYGLHGPITYSCPDGASDCDLLDRQWFLKRGFVSHGCMRMDHEDIVDLYYMVASHPSVPVSIQTEPEVDGFGQVVDVDMSPAVPAIGEALRYGECGERPDPYEIDGRWTSRKCL